MDDLDLETLAGRLELARRLRGWSRRRLSLEAGLGEAAAAQIAGNPDANPTAATVTALAEALSVDVGWLICGKGPSPLVATVRQGTE